jgi:hypothetical protein
MDETALLALGILMEELCRETLGNTGDMVFTESDLVDETQGQRYSWKVQQSVINAPEAATRSGRTRSRKRRRIETEDSAESG